ncbi:MAG: ATP-binding protein [Spirochaetales bacterium]|nr:ATP-binding protein [Spirochaetales bacterium]
MFRRKIYDKLLDWKKNCKGTKALLIEGARRIGKSTVVEEFGKNEYKSYILIDFNKVNRVVIEAFENLSGKLDDFFMVLSSEYNTQLYKKESLIIFDEVQKYPHARELIKYFVADGRYDYIETGSLISIKENVKDITIPSEERKIKMYPMDFEEFCWALGNGQILEAIRSCFGKKESLPKGLHNSAMLLFRQYLLVGGMPKSVDVFVTQSKDFGASDVEKRDILDLYREDIRKIDKKYQAKVQTTFDQIPAFLSKHEKRIILSRLDPNAKSGNYEESFFWLADSMICNECFNCSDPNVGLAMNEDRTFIKCYMGDTGLLVSHAFSENDITETNLYKNILFDKLSINEGMLYENAIMQMLTANGHRPYFYTNYNEDKHRNDIEIDFIITEGGKIREKIIPIEVKSSSKYSTVSLERFMSKFKNRISSAYVIHPRNLLLKDGIICIPPYMTFCL